MAVKLGVSISEEDDARLKRLPVGASYLLQIAIRTYDRTDLTKEELLVRVERMARIIEEQRKVIEQHERNTKVGDSHNASSIGSV